MSQAELHRLRSDLDLIRTAVGAKLPFGPADVRCNCVVATLGAILVAWSAWALGKHPSFTAISIIAVLLSVVAINAHRSLRNRTQRLSDSAGLNLFLGILLGGLAIGLFFYALWLGVAFHHVVGLSLAVVGITGIGIFPLLDRPRRLYLVAQAAVLLLYGLAISANGNLIGIATGGWLALSGLLTAVIMSAQIRAAGADHVAD